MDIEVIDSEGVRGRIVGRVQRSGGSERVAVAAADKHFRIPADALEEREHGSQFLPERFESFERLGDEEAATLPVIEEQLRVTTRPREERIRVEKRVGTREESLDLPVTAEEVEVERVAVDR